MGNDYASRDIQAGEEIASNYDTYRLGWVTFRTWSAANNKLYFQEAALSATAPESLWLNGS